MEIESNYITAIPHSEDTSTAIEIFDQPVSITTSPEPLIPGRIVGYYDSSTDRIQLYVADGNGLRYIPVKLKV